MDSKPTVRLPEALIFRCDLFANEVLASYANGYNAASLAVSSHGAERNWNLQARAKQGECALAVHMGLDPERCLHWGRNCDPGFDLRVAGQRIDVKTIKHEHRFLCWPVNKRHIWQSKPFDALVLVKENLPAFTIWGWISKADFFREKQVAPAGHKLTDGTWFVPQSRCQPIEDLTRAVGDRFVRGAP